MEPNSVNISQSSLPHLRKLADLINKHPEWDIQLTGHTDNTGDEDYNFALSKQRAEAVKHILIKNGVDKSQIKVDFYGEYKPISSNDTEAGRKQNRRVEIDIVKKN